CLKTDSEITGLDRSNAEEDTSEWLELMISKKKCSVDEVNAILELLLTGIVNESTGEEGYINEYDDNSRHIAVLMNLAEDVLKIVPMKDMGWKNDGQGDRPKEFDEWVRELAEGLLELITALIVAVGDFLKSLAEAAVEAGLKFAEMIAKAVMALIEAILKAAILALIYAFYSIIIAGLIITISSLFILSLPSVAIFGGDINYTATKFKMNALNKTFEFGYETLMEYNNILDFDVPYISMFLLIGGNKIFNLDIYLFPLKINIEDPPLMNESPETTSDELEIINPEHIMYWTPFGMSTKDITLNFKYNGKGDPTFSYTLTRTDTNEIIKENEEWIEETTISLGEGAYLLEVKAIVNGEEIEKSVTFSIVDQTEFADGFGTILGIVGSLILLMDVLQTYVSTIEKQLPSIGLIAGSVFIAMLAYITLGFSPSALFGAIISTAMATILLAWVTFSFIQGIVKLTTAYFYASKTIFLILSIVSLALQGLDFALNLADISIIENIFDYIQVIIAIGFFIGVLYADKTVSLFMCKYNWQLFHKVFIIVMIVVFLIELMWFILSGFIDPFILI
ncbi:MAG: hypothetical protein ACTSPD_21530, partial [Promethearchaeota archaeon]